jgi:regulator of cell morphogenesis and NO signaling
MTSAPACSSPSCHLTWTSPSLSGLIDHIVHRHHGYLRKQLPKLCQLATHSIDAGTPNPVRTAQDVRRILAVLTKELALKMLQEEAILFPWIRQLESAEGEISATRSLFTSIAMMQQEHRFVMQGLDRLRWLTNDYSPPALCGPEYRWLLMGLADLDTDLHQHIHEEDDLLFPRAMELESVALLHA